MKNSFPEAKNYDKLSYQIQTDVCVLKKNTRKIAFRNKKNRSRYTLLSE